MLRLQDILTPEVRLSGRIEASALTLFAPPPPSLPVAIVAASAPTTRIVSRLLEDVLRVFGERTRAPPVPVNSTEPGSRTIARALSPGATPLVATSTIPVAES